MKLDVAKDFCWPAVAGSAEGADTTDEGWPSDIPARAGPATSLQLPWQQLLPPPALHHCWYLRRR